MDFASLCAVPEWPRFLGYPRARGILRSRPEDFSVRELPLVEPSGEGSHLWLEVQKCGANTDWIAGQLARAAACHVRDVGYAGMKDRHAVTTQWFSLPAPAGIEPDWADWDIPGARVLQYARHGKKLKRGVLKGNRFEIVIRHLEGDLEDLGERLKQLASRGLPNYFGPQRFGHARTNALSGARWLTEGGRLPRARRSIYLSALRSLLFNHVLADRVRQGDWDRLLDGEVAMLDGTQSVFLCGLPAPDLERRCREFDIHPTGPMAGEGGVLPVREAANREGKGACESECLINLLFQNNLSNSLGS